jgi:hypothetical protein
MLPNFSINLLTFLFSKIQETKQNRAKKVVKKVVSKLKRILYFKFLPVHFHFPFISPSCHQNQLGEKFIKVSFGKAKKQSRKQSASQ